MSSPSGVRRPSSISLASLRQLKNASLSIWNAHPCITKTQPGPRQRRLQPKAVCISYLLHFKVAPCFFCLPTDPCNALPKANRTQRFRGKYRPLPPNAAELFSSPGRQASCRSSDRLAYLFPMILFNKHAEGLALRQAFEKFVIRRFSRNHPGLQGLAMYVEQFLNGGMV